MSKVYPKTTHRISQETAQETAKTRQTKSETNSVLPPFLFPSKSKTQQAWMSRLIQEKKIRSIAPRLYTSLSEGQLESAVRGSWSDIVSHLYPDSLLSYRSAIEYRPNKNGEIFLTGATNRRVQYPGLTLVFIRGPKPLVDDPSFLQFRVSSFPRALLENLSSTKRTAERSLSEAEIEEKLEEILQIKGEAELNQIRDQASRISLQGGWIREFRKLDGIIGALLGTRSAKDLKSSSGKARSLGRPYESSRIEKFDLLFSELIQTPVQEIKDPFHSSSHFRHKAFFEAYFSNYIEGTVFEIDEAEEIIFQKRIPSARPKDGHDILRSFQIVSDQNEMNQVPIDFFQFEELLKNRHETLMLARPEALPGRFKVKPNRAESTHFVPPELVSGTLEKGFERLIHLPQGITRAVFMMFLISEVHPFTDGNGRIARIMMNAELFSQGLSTIIIPTVFREDYLLSLRALSRMNRPKALVRTLIRAQRFSCRDFDEYPVILRELQNRNWFKEPDEAKLID